MESSHQLPTWVGKASTLMAHSDRVELYVLCPRKDDRSLCRPRILAAMVQQSGDSDFDKLGANITRTEFPAEGGCDKILETLTKCLFIS